MSKTIPILEYATPRRRRTQIDGKVYCVFATLPAALMAFFLLMNQRVNLVRLPSSLEYVVFVPFVLLGFVFASSTWLALLVLHLIEQIRGIPPSAALVGRQPRYVLIMLAGFVSMLPPNEPESLNWVLFVGFHLALFGWLTVDLYRGNKIGRIFVVGIVLLLMFLSTRVHRCPHATDVSIFSISFNVSGQRCGNDRSYWPWWTIFGPM